MALRLPIARSGTEAICYGFAGITALSPFYMMMPGAEDRLANQTARWAPRWERNISYFIPRVERGIKRVEPPVSRTVRRMESRLPLERLAQNVDKRIKNGIGRVSRHQHRHNPANTL